MSPGSTTHPVVTAPRAGLPYMETFVGRRDVILTCQLPEQRTVPRLSVTARHVTFFDLGVQVALPVPVIPGQVRATFVNGTMDLHLRRESAG